ncbi:MAG: hypothetical protein O8C62_03475 [Candidatus Methanoperedens sp.]|nr:hypothetical protein [Candidatus Methanoperedens sp.]
MLYELRHERPHPGAPPAAQPKPASLIGTARPEAWGGDPAPWFSIRKRLEVLPY